MRCSAIADSLAGRFHEQLQELLGYLENRGPSTGPFRQEGSIHFESPEPWLLGSSAQSGIWAAELGLPYVFADSINPEWRTYRRVLP